MPRIRVIDTETQGLEPHHLVCEFGWCDLVNDGDGWRVDRGGSSLHRVDSMPPEARAAHHISAEDTQAFPPFDPATMWADCKADAVDVVAAHNWAFDGMRFGEPQLPVICTMKSARRAWPLDPPGFSNGVLRYWLQDAGKIAPDPAHCLPPHRAGPDAYVTAHIMLALLAETTAAQCVAWTKDRTYYGRCPIGDPWRGKPWEEVDFGFVKWIVDRRKDDPDLVWNAQRELDRRRAAA